MVGKGVRVLLQKAFACRQVRLAGASFDAAVKDYIAQCLKTGNGETRVFPGVAEALGALRSKGIKTALVTNKSRAMTLSLLADKGLAPLLMWLWPEMTGIRRNRRPICSWLRPRRSGRLPRIV